MKQFCLLTLSTVACAADVVAVWDPGVKFDHLRFSLDPARSAEVAAWLSEDGRPVERITSAQIQGGALDAKRIAVLVMPGDVVPRGDLPALTAFINAGGVPVLLRAKVPWLSAIAPSGGQTWDMSPREPRFAWQISELQSLLGIKYAYTPALQDAGVDHRPTALLTRYLPEAKAFTRQLPSSWMHSQDGGEFIPLLAATRNDGETTVPALYVLRRERRQAVVCGIPELTAGPQPWFAGSGKPLVRAMVALACDLQAGKITLDGAERSELTATPKPIEPLLTRLPEGQCDPDGAKALVRWGRFDGSARELGTAGSLPRRLDPGASAVLPVADLPAGSRWLRVRLAFRSNNAGLRLATGSGVVHDERFVYHDASGNSNHGSNQWANEPIEVQRVVALPPGALGSLTFSNPGDQPVWFDAAQIESAVGRSSAVEIGFHAGFESTLTQEARDKSPDPNIGKTWTIDPALAVNWAGVRIDPRLNLVGPPDDPKRWEASDELFANYRSYGRPLHVCFGNFPKWLATEASYAEAVTRKRPHICVPRADLWPGFLAEWIARYGKDVATYEVGNEVDIKQFWIGTTAEWRTWWEQTRDTVRKLDPGKDLLTPGLAVQAPEWIQVLIDSGAFRDAKYAPNHCYAGQTPAWDLVFGKFEGFMMAKGIQTQLFANEQGMPYKNSEWFTDNWTPEKQAVAIEAATARLYASAMPRITLFHAGGGIHSYGVIDEKGVPRPAYRRYEPYLALNGPGAQRLDVSLTAAASLTGTYAAGAVRGDGSAVVVVNPCEAPGRSMPAVTVAFWLPDARPRVAQVTVAGASTELQLRQDGAWVSFQLPEGGLRSVRLTVR
jgi:hypothetical protein